LIGTHARWGQGGGGGGGGFETHGERNEKKLGGAGLGSSGGGRASPVGGRPRKQKKGLFFFAPRAEGGGGKKDALAAGGPGPVWLFFPAPHGPGLFSPAFRGDFGEKKKRANPVEGDGGGGGPGGGGAPRGGFGGRGGPGPPRGPRFHQGGEPHPGGRGKTRPNPRAPRWAAGGGAVFLETGGNFFVLGGGLPRDGGIRWPVLAPPGGSGAEKKTSRARGPGGGQ